MKKTASFLTALSIVLNLCVINAAAENTLSDNMLAEISDRIRAAIDSGENAVDISDYGVVVEMRSDSLSPEYSAFLDMLQKTVGMYKFNFGEYYSESPVSAAPDFIPTENCNEYGVGDNIINTVYISYDERYRNDDGTCDTALLAADRQRIEREYAAALSSINDDMNDVEKALALYDYVIALINYPDDSVITQYEDGFAQYPPEKYTVASALLDRSAVCTAYAALYAALLNDVGIPAITVDSGEISHCWTMLHIDGAWYHADPTWDDPNYMFPDEATGLYLTKNWDHNNDCWDEGAAQHDYFLKSDSEITALGHYGWENYSKFKTAENTPSADVSGAFKDKFFSTYDVLNTSHFCYINGKWYFADDISGKIISASYGDTPSDFVPIDLPPYLSSAKYLFSYGDFLYVCKSENIYRADPETLDIAALIGAPEGCDFTEMSIVSDTLRAISVNNETLEFIEAEYPAAELAGMTDLSAENVTETAVTTAAQTEPPETETPETETTESAAVSPDRAAISKENIAVWLIIGAGGAAAVILSTIALKRKK